MTFNSLVDEVRTLSYEEKIEIKALLDRFLAEERRQDISRNHQEALAEARAGVLTFSSDLGELREMLES